MIKRTWQIIILSFLLAGCQGVSQENSYAEIELGNSTSKDISESAVVDYEVIPLETLDECLIDFVAKVLKYEGNYYLLSGGQNSRLFVFDANGKFIRAVGNIGNGPGEYTGLTDFCVDNATGNILCLTRSYPSNIMVYNKLGEFEKKVAVGEGGLWHIATNNRKVYLSSDYRHGSKDEVNYLIYTLDSDFKLINKSIEYNDISVLFPPLANKVFSKSKDLYYFDSFFNTLYVNTNSEWNKKVQFRFADRSADISVFSSYEKFMANQNKFNFFESFAITEDSFLGIYFSNKKSFLLNLNLNTFNYQVYKINNRIPQIQCYEDEHLYSIISSMDFIENIYGLDISGVTITPTDNPVILKFKLSNIK